MKQLTKLFSNGGHCETWAPTKEGRPLKGRLRVISGRKPIELQLSKRVFLLYPDEPLDPEKRNANVDWILVDPEQFRSGIGGFVRLRYGEPVLIGRVNDVCKKALGLSKPVSKRHLAILNQGDELVLTPLDSEAKTTIAAVTDPDQLGIGLERRRRNLDLACEVLGRPIELLPPDKALAAVTQVVGILEDEAHRPKDSDGRPGGVLVLPKKPVPVIVGDLHAQVDNLLKILSENNFLEEIDRGDAYLLFLGDLLHSEAKDELAEMDSSLLIMDLFVKLKIRFPKHVFCLRGNHESYDESAGKAGVPQGLLFRERALRLRGKDYVDELARLFKLLPYVAKTDQFVACHAGPPRGEVSFQKFVDLSRHRRLAGQLVTNRMVRPNNPFGYTKHNVKRFRANVGVDKHTPVIVGHTHVTPDETVWLNVGEIKQHHVVTCANQHNLAVFVRLGQEMVPLEYPAEPLLSVVNRASSKHGGQKRKRSKQKAEAHH